MFHLFSTIKGEGGVQPRRSVCICSGLDAKDSLPLRESIRLLLSSEFAEREFYASSLAILLDSAMG